MGEWREVSFGSLGRLFDGPHATPTRRSEGPYFLNISSLKSGRLDLSESDHVSDEDFGKWTRRVTPRFGDLLFSYETRLGEAALMPEGIRACLGRRMALLRPDPSVIDSRFLLYLYLSPKFQQTIAERAIHGATVPRIGLATMNSWTVHIPEIEEQRAIAEVLGALDDKIAVDDKIASTAIELGDAFFVQEFASARSPVATIGEIADHSVIEFSDGYRTKRSEHGRPGLRILRAGDVRNSYIYPAGDDYVAIGFLDKIGRKASEPGDIVLTTKGTVGRVAVVAEDIERVVYSPQVCFFRVIDASKIDRSYLAAWFGSADLQNQASTLMFKSDMAPYISLRDIRSLVLPLPPIEVQRRHGDFQRRLQATFAANRLERAALAATRDELLPLLMSGKVRVGEAKSVVKELS